MKTDSNSKTRLQVRVAPQFLVLRAHGRQEETAEDGNGTEESS